MNSKEAVLEYLPDHPGWHYGLDLVNAGLAPRSMIYIYLGDLEEEGSVARRDSPEPPPPGCLPRPQ